MKSVCVLLYAPRPSRPPASPVLQQTASSAFLYTRLFLHHTLPLCRTSNDHSTPRGALKFPPPHLSSRPLSPGSLRTGTHDICLSERGRRSRTPLPVCQRIILACHAIQHLLFSTGRAEERKKKSQGKMREREREKCGKHFHGFQMLYCLCQIAPQIHVTGFIHQCLRCNHYHII